MRTLLDKGVFIILVFSGTLPLSRSRDRGPFQIWFLGAQLVPCA